MRLLIFLPSIVILACDSSSLAFPMMYSACNKQDNNIQPYHTPFPIWNQFIVPCPVLTVAFWTAYRFLRRQVGWSGYSHLFKNFPQFVGIYTVKGFCIVNETEVDIFLEFPCFLYYPMNVGKNSISGSSAFSKASLYIWRFSFHILLKSSLKDFEHKLTSMWMEHNCLVICTFFGITLLWDWN